MENILTASSEGPELSALQIYERVVGLAATGTYIAWQHIADRLRAEAERFTGCARRKRIDRALDCESRALAQRTAAAFRAELDRQPSFVTTAGGAL